jgi:hypothetical protein
MQQRSCNAYVRRNHHPRPRILVEDDTLDPTTLDLSPAGFDSFDIITCTGPASGEVCPFVMDHGCPAGTPDVVVSALSPDHPWAEAVRAAWEREGVPVAPTDGPLEWPAHIGAAIRVFFPEADPTD